MSNEYDTFLQEEIVCPHCGYTELFSAERFESDYLPYSTERTTQCEDCNKKFTVRCDTWVRFSSWKGVVEDA